LPALIAGGVAWIVFIAVGSTPILRASGMALAVIGMALALRPMGAALATVGALALALSPSFWIQTGGAESLNPLHVGAALIGAILLGMLALRFSQRPFVGAALALLLFAALFLTTIGTPRSLRLTTLLTAWTLYLLVDGLFVSSPRPDSPETGTLGAQHTYGLLVLLGVGIVNDPLFVLLAPAVTLGMFLSRKRLPRWYWMALAAVAIYGIAGISQHYYSDFWWHFSPDQVSELPFRHIPYLIAEGWREPGRWIGLSQLVIGQFTIVGLALGVLGLARLARWYPPVGVVTMVAYGTYGVFGLIYFGEDRPVLLLPLLMIQLLWMTYAVATFGQWLEKSLHLSGERVTWFAAAVFTLLPLFMLLRIIGAV
jgi:hypothetical protein